MPSTKSRNISKNALLFGRQKVSGVVCYGNSNDIGYFKNCLSFSTSLLLSVFFAFIFVLTLVATPPQNAFAETHGSDKVGDLAASDQGIDTSTLPDVSCSSGILTTQSGKVLWSRDCNEKLPMASLTKIMTAMVCLDSGNLSDKITISSNAASTDGSTAYLAAGDELTMEDLLYCMLLPSGNDAAVALAEKYGSTEDGFVEMMNNKASELGLESTHFSHPSGLEDDNNYTTASDYAKLVSYAMKNDTFRKVVATKKYSYTSTTRGYNFDLSSTNSLLSSYDGMIGVKTGFTDEAGYCFVGAAKKDGIELYLVLLDCDSEDERFEDAKTALNWGFSHYRSVMLIGVDTVVAQAVDTDYLDVTVPAVASEEVSIVAFDYDSDLDLDVAVNETKGAIEVGDALGSITWSQDGEELVSVDLVSSITVSPPTFFERLEIGWTKFTSLFTGQSVSVESSVDIDTVQALIDL